ncbi:MAG: aspartate aminotransferase family protein [Bacteroidales bacterium]|nr:aspartate aminotransferase family protein [Bacteroidales bacterium]
MNATHRELFLNYLGQTSDSPYMVEIERAKGVYMYGPDNKRYIDLISGVSVSSLGHCNDEVVKAIREQIDSYMHLMVYGEFIQSPQVKLAEYICGMLPERFNNVYFVNSGSEAIEGATKLAKRYTRRHKMFSFVNAYHGSTQGALSLCGNEDFKRSFYPLLPDVHHLELNNFEQLKQIDGDTACVVLESIQAEGGVLVPTVEYMRELRSVCTKNGALLILDEIQTGFGRTGKMFAFQHFGIEPDIICFAKALGGGMPIGAFVSSQKIMSSFKTDPILGHITTFGGHPVSAAAALASVKIINESGIVDSVEQKAERFRQNLINHRLVSEIRGKGLLLAVEIGSFDNVLKFIKKAIDNGIISDWFVFHDSAFRIAPPLTITNDEIDEASELIIKTLNEI